MPRFRLVLLAVLCFLASPRAWADGENWTRFRGPNGLGVSTATDLPIEFGPETNVRWKTRLPSGHSSPVFTASHIFVTAHTPEKEAYRLLVIALDRTTGKQLWEREVPRLHRGRVDNINGPASPSPVTDGADVYAFFQEFGLISFTADGRERWRLPLGPFNMFYGFGASPVLADDTLVLAVDQDQGAYLLAVDVATGRPRWKVDRPHVISGYSTPTIYRPPNGATQILIPESFQLTAYALADGRRMWWVRGLACEMKSVASLDGGTLYINGWGFPQNQAGQQVPTVPFAEGLKRYDGNGDGHVAVGEISGREPMDRMLRPGAFAAFDGNRDGRLNAQEWGVFRAMLASENGLMAIEVGGQGDMTERAVRWKYLRPVPQVPSTLLYRGVLFMVNDSGILIAFDPDTGAVLKQGRLKGAIDKYFASPVGADGKVWLVSQDGTVSVVSAEADWQILSVNALGEEVLATPVPAHGVLYIRTRTALYAFEQRPAQLIQPGAPGEPSRVISATEAVDLSQVGHTPADVRFMQGMIGHHAQAIEMTDLLETRTASGDMRMLALRIEVSQRDEIRMMQEWLQARGASVPDEHAHHAHGATLMPGMLTPDEMARLAAAKGAEFDRLFLEFMIKHHGGALTMVDELFSSPGAGQESEMFAFASDVEADQQMEINRMAAMLKELQK